MCYKKVVDLISEHISPFLIILFMRFSSDNVLKTSAQFRASIWKTLVFTAGPVSQQLITTRRSYCMGA